MGTQTLFVTMYDMFFLTLCISQEQIAASVRGPNHVVCIVQSPIAIEIASLEVF